MKNIFIISLILLFTSAAFTQNESSQGSDRNEIQTLFGNNVEHGGYGAIMVNYSLIDGKDAWLAGMRGGWLIDHRFMIGLGGYGFANNLYFDNVLSDRENFLTGGYGGLVVEPILLPRFPVHLSFPVLIGAGGIAHVDGYYWNHNDYQWNTIDASAFFVIEPGVELELNMVRHFRVAFAVTYRYTGDIKLIDMPKDVMNGFNYGLAFKFGKF